MRLKHRPNDFRVRELLKDDVLVEAGPHNVYKVTKRKLTSLEAAEVLADMANVPAGDVAMAGLKDRQGVTEQFMSIPGGKRVSLHRPELKIVAVGKALVPLTAENSYGNAFEVRLRDLSPFERKRLLAHRHVVGRLGVPNYFDEQRFGNLRHGQGWVAKELMLGNEETALRNLLCAESDHDAGRIGAFKRALRSAWGDWSACREVAGKYGEHHSVFEHLRQQPQDFPGAFFHISSRLRLIHLYAFQSHIWNRAVAAYMAELSGDGGARVGSTLEGPQVFPDRKLDVDLDWDGALRLPGEGLEDVTIDSQRKWLERALADEGLTPEQFRIQGISGFQLKGEDRRLFIRPRNLKVELERGADPRACSARLTFELPRGAYATLVVRGLLARFVKGRLDLARLAEEGDRPPRRDGHKRGPRQDGGGEREGGGRWNRRDDRRPRDGEPRRWRPHRSEGASTRWREEQAEGERHGAEERRGQGGRSFGGARRGGGGRRRGGARRGGARRGYGGRGYGGGAGSGTERRDDRERKGRWGGEGRDDRERKGRWSGEGRDDRERKGRWSGEGRDDRERKGRWSGEGRGDRERKGRWSGERRDDGDRGQRRGQDRWRGERRDDRGGQGRWRDDRRDDRGRGHDRGRGERRGDRREGDDGAPGSDVRGRRWKGANVPPPELEPRPDRSREDDRP